MKKYKLEYYEWEEIQKSLNTILGRDIRDFARPGKKGARRKNNEYLDFWHWWLDNVGCGDIHNDVYGSVCLSDLMEEKIDEPEWVQEILQAMKTLFGKLAEQEIIIHYDW